jgi:hypothetical protein
MTLISIPLPMPMPVPAAPAAASSSSSASGSSSSAPDAPVDDEEAKDAEKKAAAPTDFNELLAAVLAASATPVTPAEVAPTPVVATEPVTPDINVALAQIPIVVAPVAPIAVAPVEVPVPEAVPATPVVPEATAPVVTAAVAETAAPVVAPEAEAPKPIAIDDEPETADVPTPDAPVLDAPTVPLVAERTAVREPAPAPAAPAPEVAAVVARAVHVDAPAAAPTEEPTDRTAATDPVATAPAAPSVSTPVATPAPRAEAPAPAPRVHTPIVTAVIPLVQRGDGSYHVAVRLHPEELGAVDIDVELRGGEINLRLRTETVAGRDAIRLALPMLRSELEAAGVQTGTFDLGDQPSGQLPQQQQGSNPSTPAFTTASLDDVPVPDTDAEADPAALDVRV